MKPKHAILSILIAFAVGFFAGRATVGTKEIIKYVKGETVVRTVKVPEPKTVFVPQVYYLPTRPDTIVRDSIMTEIQVVDTAKIIVEFVTRNTYDFNVFNNEQGKLDINQVIQYNRLQSFDYRFTPIHIEKTSYRRPLFEPFISASYNTFGIAGIGGGLFYRNTGVEYNYLYSVPGNRTGHMVGVKVKF